MVRIKDSFAFAYMLYIVFIVIESWRTYDTYLFLIQFKI